VEDSGGGKFRRPNASELEKEIKNYQEELFLEDDEANGQESDEESHREEGENQLHQGRQEEDNKEKDCQENDDEEESGDDLKAEGQSCAKEFSTQRTRGSVQADSLRLSHGEAP